MKSLQESKEESWHLKGCDWQLKTIECRPESPKSLTLLLHGLDERGLRIFRKIRKFISEDSYIIAPNGPFPIPRVRPERVDFGFSWYFFDPFTKQYIVDQTLALSLLTDLLKQANPHNLPVTIIGFSQGGYLAPLVGYAEKNTKHVIGIGCEFKTKYFPHPPEFTVDAIHGLMDTVVSPAHALQEISGLKERGISVVWHPITELKHEINVEVGLTIKKILEQYGEGSL
ncbi:MAG: hypothetical protein H0V66_00135 [Bdellovibrionales bacterium]|nr:hypothetical protein [Bdellovibrionales bacterium]